jgi:hypothetical protein
VFVGPAGWFRLTRESVLQGPDGDVVARWRGEQWVVRNMVCNRFDCRQPLSIHLEDGTGRLGEELGQFDECVAVGGAVYGDGALVANWVAEQSLWVSAESEEVWPALVIRASDARRGYPPWLNRSSGP